MELYQRYVAARVPARVSRSVCLIFLGLAAVLISSAQNARAQGASLAELRSQIQRYGCNLPQYANSVAGCRRLHARVRALQSGNAGSYSYRQPYGASSRYTTRAPARPSAPSDPVSGFFGALFGGGSPGPGRDGYNMSRAYDSEWRSGRWNGTYPSYMRGYGRYRTLCVRTCDGYYWPMSFSTTRASFARDAQQCSSSCSAPAELFVHRNPGADVEHMVDLQGKPYTQLENAFRYREEYVKDCRCKPEPWSEAAQKEFEQRAAEAENPGQAKVAANETGDAGGNAQTTARPSAGYAPRPRRAMQRRYRTQDAQFSGQWWAGSW